MTGQIAVHRPRHLQNSAALYIVEVDGRKVGEFYSGGTILHSATAGEHEVRVRLDVFNQPEMGYCGSPPWIVDVVDGETAALEVTPVSGSVSSAAAKWGASATTPTSEAWLLVLPAQPGDRRPRPIRRVAGGLLLVAFVLAAFALVGLPTGSAPQAVLNSVAAVVGATALYLFIYRGRG